MIQISPSSNSCPLLLSKGRRIPLFILLLLFSICLQPQDTRRPNLALITSRLINRPADQHDRQPEKCKYYPTSLIGSPSTWRHICSCSSNITLARWARLSIIKEMQSYHVFEILSPCAISLSIIFFSFLSTADLYISFARKDGKDISHTNTYKRPVLTNAMEGS